MEEGSKEEKTNLVIGNVEMRFYDLKTKYIHVMARKFEDIEVWQLSRNLVKDIFLLTKNEPLRKMFNVCDQVQRAALSVMNNIAEGLERQSDKELIYFLYIAKGSAGEVRSMLYVLLDMEYIDQKMFNKLFDSLMVISKSLSGFITYLKAKKPII